MTNEEMQKTMEFILEQQAQFAVNIQRLQEERLRDHPRLIRLEESFQLVVQLAQTSDTRFDTLELNMVRDRPRLTRLEESFQLLVQLAQNADTRLDTLESSTDTRFVGLESNTDTRFGAFESNMVTLESNMAALAVAQAQSEEKLGALIDIVREGRNGKS